MTSVQCPALRLNDGKVSPACEAGPGTAGKLAPHCRHRTHAVQKKLGNFVNKNYLSLDDQNI